MKLRKKRRAMNIKLVAPAFNQKEKLADDLIGILLSLLLFTSVGGMLINMFSVAVIGILPVICAAAVIAAYYLLGDLPIKKKLIALGCLFGADILAFAIAFKYARAGFYSVINHVSAVFNIESLKIHALFETGVSPDIETGCATLFLSLIAPLLALLCAWLVQNSFKLDSVIIMAVIAALGIMEAVNHAGIWSGLLCVTIALIIMRSLISSGSLTTMPVVCGVILCACLIGTVVTFIFARDSMTGLELKLGEKKYSISQNIHKMRYEKDSIVEDEDGDIETLMMPEGDFFAIRKELSPSFETTMNVTMSDCEEVQSVYLRGYIGEVYTEKGWRPLPKKTLGEYGSLFYQLHKNGFYPQTQLALVSDILDEEIDKDSLIPVEVEIETACKGFVYAPYELYSANSVLLREDSLDTARLGNKGSSGLQKYSYNILPNQVKRYNKLDELFVEQSAAPSDRLSEYMAMEAKYRSFVYSNYTAISDEHKDFLSGFIGEPGIAGQTHISYDDARKTIFKVMGDVMEYEEEVARFHGESSFLRFVLRELQYGYAPHYATATVMMLRHYGIPARYVEGYVITPDDAESTEPGDELAITDYSAHAWAEYYHDGLGWLPLDTSPNFANIMEGTGAPPEYLYEAPSEVMEEEEEIPPVYDKDRNKKDEPKVDEIVKKAFPWIVFAVIILLLVFGWWYRRMTILRKRRAACNDDDNNAAVCAMMQYMTLLLESCSIKSHRNTHAAMVEVVSENWGEEWEKNFGKTTIIFQKAAYSQHAVSNQERADVEETLNEMLKKVDSLQTFRSRLKLRYIKCVY